MLGAAGGVVKDGLDPVTTWNQYPIRTGHGPVL